MNPVKRAIKNKGAHLPLMPRIRPKRSSSKMLSLWMIRLSSQKRTHSRLSHLLRSYLMVLSLDRRVSSLKRLWKLAAHHSLIQARKVLQKLLMGKNLTTRLNCKLREKRMPKMRQLTRRSWCWRPRWRCIEGTHTCLPSSWVWLSCIWALSIGERVALVASKR